MSQSRYAHFGRPKTSEHKAKISAGLRSYQERVRAALRLIEDGQISTEDAA